MQRITSFPDPIVTRYRVILVPSAEKYHDFCHSMGIPSPKKKFIYGVLSVKNISDHSRVRANLSNFSFLGQRDFTLGICMYLLRYSDWNLLRSDFLIVEDQSKRSILERD